MKEFCCLIGNFGDNSWILWEGLRLKYNLYDYSYFGLYGMDFNYLKNLVEPLTYLPFLFLSKFINTYYVWNFFVIFFIFLSGLFSYLFLIKKTSKTNAILLSLLWISSSYFSIHSRDHLSLLAAFLYPIYLIVSLVTNKKDLIIKYIFLVLTFLISIYISVFLIFINFFSSIYEFVKDKSKIKLLDLILSITLLLGLSFSLKIAFPDTSKNIDNFLIFSYKPWHSFDRPDNLAINFIDTSDLINFDIKNNIYFNYFEFEHSVGYFGLLFLLFFTYTLIKYWNKLDKKIFYLLIVSLLISLPPVIYFKGITFYTPSYLFFLLFDQFRILARINIFSFLLMIIIFSSLLDYNKIFKNIFVKVFIFLIFIIDIFFPYKLSSITGYDQNFYERILGKTSKDSLIILFPYDNELNLYKEMQFLPRKFVNPKDYLSTSPKFNSAEFTQNLSCERINELQISKDTYLLYVLGKENEELPKLNLQKIDSSQKLVLYKIECKD